jgi:hypothetical protein
MDEIIDEAESIARAEAGDTNLRRLALLVREIASYVQDSEYQGARYISEVEREAGTIAMEMRGRCDELERRIDSLGYDVSSIERQVQDLGGRID